ncbi:GTP-binding protein [Gloeocapsa sp. PCC 73106]|uniref:GTP-binding protein n=1 Tax=Gloeocapsa sp. PCC 73106 TaxID=102232 RepID=UPI0002ACC517|nr:GTP-binding protein [Gloeocapsa sp. PCC 73106]ELR98980.1 small GTP-binding protein domain protein [Gloeocapsa sp. PCC 73106]
MTNPGENHLNQARASLQQALSWYSSFRRHWNYPPNAQLQAAVREDLQTLKFSLDKLDQTLIKIATFGLVSRGKSAVVNALVGQKILATGPLHGVTQWPKSVRWTPSSGKVQVELIDTPGLDEIAGEARADMAREVASEADLILFVVAGDITRTEYQALSELRRAQKPLILVFNKIDLYPEQDQESILAQLQQLGSVVPDAIVRVAAEPQPIPVRVEWPDGRITQDWETPPVQISELREKILAILNQQGRSLLALNALFQAREAEINIATKTLEIRQSEAETIIGNYAKYKALGVAINPVPFLDVLGGTLADLVLIRSLARLYGLPITNYETGKLWKTIFTSTGGLLLGEIITSTVLGVSKISAWTNPTDFTIYTGTALTQAAIAGYGSYIVGKATQAYLQQGCSWGPLGPSTVIQDILAQIEPDSIIASLTN